MANVSRRGASPRDNPMNRARPIALIPAYKPADILPDMVAELASGQHFDAIYCVDDGSGEAYAAVFQKLAELGVHILRHEHNQGKGMALKTGLNRIALDEPGAPGVVTFDADGQHLVHDIVRVAQNLGNHPKKVVLGCRSIPIGAPLRCRVGNALTARVFKFLSGTFIPDTQTGLRGIPMALLPDLVKLNTRGYDFELDMLLVACRNGIDFAFVPIEAIYQNNNDTSHFKPVVDSLKIYFVFLRMFAASKSRIRRPRSPTIGPRREDP